MNKTRTLWLAPLLAAGALLAAVPVAGQPRPQDDDEPTEYRDRQDVRDAYRRGYERGYDRGYRKGREDGDRRPIVTPPPPPSPPPIVLGPIRVERAVYGSGRRNCDATRYVRRQVDGRRTGSFKVSNGMCGDPDHGDRKTLEVTYWCGQVSKSSSAREHQNIYFDCMT